VAVTDRAAGAAAATTRAKVRQRCSRAPRPELPVVEFAPSFAVVISLIFAVTRLCLAFIPAKG
jgi:hypothetical protein